MPKVVGKTAAGDPIFEIRSVQLVLIGDAPHFSRIVACSRCGLTVPGPPILTPADLDHAPNPVICKECVKTSTANSKGPAYFKGPAYSKGTVVPGGRLPDASADAIVSSGRTVGGSPDDARLAAMERELGELARLVQGQSAQWESALDARTQKTQAEVADLAERAQHLAGTQQELRRRLDGAAERLEKVDLADRTAGALDQRLQAAGGADRQAVHALEQRMVEAMDRLAGRVDVQRSELGAALEAGLEQLHASLGTDVFRAGADVARVAQANDELVRAQGALVARLDSMEEAHDQRVRALDARIDQAVEGAMERAESRQSEGRVVLEARIAQLDAALEQETNRAGAGFARLNLGNQALREAQGEFRELLDRLAHRQRQLEAGADAEKARAEAASAMLRQATDELAWLEEQVNQRLDGVVERAARMAESDSRRRQALQTQIDEAAERAGKHEEAQRAQLRAVLETRMQQLEAALEREAERAGAFVGPLAEVKDALARLDEQVSERLDGLADRQRQLEASADAEKARAEAASATLGQATDELARLEEQVNQRLDRLVERAARTAESGTWRLEALQTRIDEAVEGAVERDEARGSQLRAVLEARIEQMGAAIESPLAEVNDELARLDAQVSDRIDRLVERAARRAESENQQMESLLRHVQDSVARHSEGLTSLRRDLEAALVDRLAEIRLAVAAAADGSASCLQDVEDHVAQLDQEVGELGELLAALDEGLGGLRSHIVASRAIVEGPTGARAEGDNGSSVVSEAAPLATFDEGPLRRLGRKSTEGAPHTAAVLAAAEGMLHQHQQLKAQVADLEHAAAAEAARAAADASSLSPLRSDIRALQAQVAAQHDAVVALSQSVERIRPKTSNPAPVTKPARRATGD